MLDATVVANGRCGVGMLVLPSWLSRTAHPAAETIGEHVVVGSRELAASDESLECGRGLIRKRHLARATTGRFAPRPAGIVVGAATAISVPGTPGSRP